MQSCFDEQTQFTRFTPQQLPPEPGYEPMQTDNTRLSYDERQRRLTQGLCLYCGNDGNVISSCPVRPPRLLVSTIQPIVQRMQPLSAVVTLTTTTMSIPAHALLDTGSAGNFISGSLCRQLHLPTVTNQTVYQVQSITGKTISSRRYVRLSVGPVQLRVGLLHEEQIHILVLEGSTMDIMLGRPWFVQHDPQISWHMGEVLKWGH